MANSPSDEADDLVVNILEEMVEKHKLTAVAISRGIELMRSIQDLLNKYSKQLANPNVVLEMEKEMIVLLGTEIDRNFYEGMMDAVARSAAAVMKIPQVKELQNQKIANAAAKLATEKGPEMDKLRMLFGKLGINLDNATVSTTAQPKSAVDNMLDSLNISPRTKKEDLN